MAESWSCDCTAPAHQHDATIALMGDLPATLVHEPLTYQRELEPHGSNWQAPDFGPGYEESAGDPRPARHELTYGMHNQVLAWADEEFAGTHALIGELGQSAHYGYQEPWYVDLPNTDVAIGQEVRPWYDDITVPIVAEQMRWSY